MAKEKGKSVADKRVRELLDFHMKLLGNRNRKFSPAGMEMAYYLDDVPWEREDDYFRIGYKMRKKFLMRTFDFILTTTVNEVEFEGSFELKLRFTGFPNIQTAYFKGGKGQGKYEQYFNDEKLLNTLKKYAKIVDVGYIIVEYNAASERLTIRVCPYPGAYMWIVFPPVFYKIPLNEEEIAALYDLTMELRRFACKRY